jgi:transcriptional regulator with XRE-family HTH domain
MQLTNFNMNERLAIYCKEKNITAYAFAKLIGVTQPAGLGILKGKQNMSQQTIMKLHDALPDLNLHWLLTGEGSMLLERAPQAQAVGE